MSGGEGWQINSSDLKRRQSMEKPDQINAERFHNVEFSTQDVTLFDQQSKILSVSKKDVRQITLKYGFQSERPFV